MPAFAGLISSMGLGFLLNTTYFFPTMVAGLFLALGALAFRAKRRQGYGPFILGTVATIFLLITKFALDSTWGVYGGIAMLIGASIWNSWPKRAKCNSAAPAELFHQVGSNKD